MVAARHREGHNANRSAFLLRSSICSRLVLFGWHGAAPGVLTKHPPDTYERPAWGVMPSPVIWLPSFVVRLCAITVEAFGECATRRMNTREIAIATMSWGRTAQEAQLLRESIRCLA